MRIKIIGENNCARATRHLLRLAGFAVSDFLPADAAMQGPAAGYAITIDLFSDSFSDPSSAPDLSSASDCSSDLSPAAVSPNARLGPDCATQQQMSSTSVPAVAGNAAMAGMPSFSPDMAAAGKSPFSGDADPGFASAGKPFLVDRSREISELRDGVSGAPDPAAANGKSESPSDEVGAPAAKACGGLASYIHFDSVDSALETAVLRHVAQLAGGPVIIDRPGGVVRSERELRIVAPCSGDARADEAAAVAIEFGILRGLLDLVSPDARGELRWSGTGRKLLSEDAAASERGAEKASSSRTRKKLWWPFAVVLFCAALSVWSAARGGVAEAGGFSRTGFSLSAFDFSPRPQQLLVGGMGDFGGESGRPPFLPQVKKPAPWVMPDGLVGVVLKGRRLKPALLGASRLTRDIVETGTEGARLLFVPQSKKPVLLVAAPLAAAQGQFATGQGFKITDGTNFLVVDPCQGQVKLYASINQTGNTQLVAGTASKKIYVCSIHVVAAAATDVAVVEGTGSVCATGTTGVSGFGGATAATGWNFAGNGGIALGSGESSLGAEGTSGDNLCIFNSGSGQVSGGISYVVE